MIRHLTVTTLMFAVAGCGSTAKVQTKEVIVDNQESVAIVSRAAEDFEDKDIEVPAYFDTQGLDYCTFDKDNESEACPLKKPVIRIYFEGNETVGSGEGATALQHYNNLQLSKMLENQLSGLSRFRIVTRDDDLIALESSTRISEQGAAEVVQNAAENRILAPDYLFKIDTVKTVNNFYGEYNGQIRFDIQMTSAVVDPFTKEKLSHPNVGKIRIKSTDVRDKETLVFSQVNGKYYTGFNYADESVVVSLVNDMASKGFDVMLTRMLSEMPSSAQVTGIRGDQLVLDRGQNAGILPDEVMVVFQYDGGFVDPIGVATVVPSKYGANGKMARWKRSDIAAGIKKQAAKGTFRSNGGAKLFAVSVGMPASFFNNRT